MGCGGTNVINTNCANALIVGGSNNTITSGANFACIVGGQNNTATATGTTSFIGGGDANQAQGAQAFVGAGMSNTASGASSAVVAGGRAHGNTASGQSSFVGAGDANAAHATGSSIIGGDANTIVAGATNACVAGGSSSTINAAGVDSFAAGHQAVVAATHANCFVWSDGGANPTTTTNTNQVVMSAAGTGGNSFIFYSNAARTLGVQVAANGVAWTAVSDRNMKENIRELNPLDVLGRVERLPIYEFSYKGADPDTVFRGPMAQDWHELFPSKKDRATHRHARSRRDLTCGDQGAYPRKSRADETHRGARKSPRTRQSVHVATQPVHATGQISTASSPTSRASSSLFSPPYTRERNSLRHLASLYRQARRWNCHCQKSWRTSACHRVNMRWRNLEPIHHRKTHTVM